MASDERPESFGMRSTQDMYRDFPAAVRSSFPLYVRTAGPQVSLPLALLPYAHHTGKVLLCLRHERLAFAAAVTMHS